MVRKRALRWVFPQNAPRKKIIFAIAVGVWATLNLYKLFIYFDHSFITPSITFDNNGKNKEFMCVFKPFSRTFLVESIFVQKITIKNKIRVSGGSCIRVSKKVHKYELGF